LIIDQLGLLKPSINFKHRMQKLAKVDKHFSKRAVPQPLQGHFGGKSGQEKLKDQLAS